MYLIYCQFQIGRPVTRETQESDLCPTVWTQVRFLSFLVWNRQCFMFEMFEMKLNSLAGNLVTIVTISGINRMMSQARQQERYFNPYYSAHFCIWRLFSVFVNITCLRHRRVNRNDISTQIIPPIFCKWRLFSVFVNLICFFSLLKIFMRPYFVMMLKNISQCWRKSISKSVVSRSKTKQLAEYTYSR